MTEKGGMNNMAAMGFGSIPVVLDAASLVDTMLSKTQRKTPTVVHKGYKIGRIRSFYMRKIKFCHQELKDKLDALLKGFPRLNEIHPFYADLCNVLYDKDNYKISLSKLKSASSLIDVISKDYLRLIKYADSLYKCQMLKKACLGRFASAVKRLKASLEYLEQVRQNMSRLPSINPLVRSVLVAGYPNVGKSSFVNRISKANVEVQPYAFTTKHLYVGHFDHDDTRWQIIDTPGILDRPLHERNTIEMSAITALAHLNASILYMVDVSETCGFTIQNQLDLLASLTPLFEGKPINIVINKTDLTPFESLPQETQDSITNIPTTILQHHNANNINIIHTCTVHGTSVEAAALTACKSLVDYRNTVNPAFTAEKPGVDRDHVIMPTSVTGNRPPVVPKRACSIEPNEYETALEAVGGGPGVYSIDLHKSYLLPAEWKYDNPPEMFNGKNVIDFVQPTIEAETAMLEENERIAQNKQIFDWDYEKYYENLKGKVKDLHMAIRTRKIEKGVLRTKKTQTPKSIQKGLHKRPNRHRNVEKIKAITEKAKALALEAPKSPDGASPDATPKTRTQLIAKKNDGILLRKYTVDKTLRNRNLTVGRNVRNLTTNQLRVIQNDTRRSQIQKLGKKGESDRFIGTAKPKHLFSGKRGIGKTQSR